MNHGRLNPFYLSLHNSLDSLQGCQHRGYTPDGINLLEALGVVVSAPAEDAVATAGAAVVAEINQTKFSGDFEIG